MKWLCTSTCVWQQTYGSAPFPCPKCCGFRDTLEPGVVTTSRRLRTYRPAAR